MKQYIFTPTDDMTVKELATIMKVLMVALVQAMSGQIVLGDDDLEIEQPVYDNLSSELRKHFKPKAPPLQRGHEGGRRISPMNPPPKTIR